MSRHLMAKFRRQADDHRFRLKPRSEGRRFDWQRKPEYDTPGLVVDHHMAPLENGDSLHVYRLDHDNDLAGEHWFHEIGPYDLPSRFPMPGGGQFDSEFNEKVNLVGDFKRRNNDFGFMNKETAMDTVEDKYLDQAHTWEREPHRRDDIGVPDSVVNYDNLINPRDDLDEDFGDIFGGSR